MGSAARGSDPSGDFLAWARLSARMLRRSVAERMRIVTDAGVSEEWSEMDAHWYAVLAEDIDKGDLTRLERYCELCEEALQEGEPLPGPSRELEAMVDAPNDQDGLPPFARRFTPKRAVPKSPEAYQAHTDMHLEEARDLAFASITDSWQLNDFAWLCAELAHWPDRASAIWDSRGIRSVAAQRHVMETWQARVDASPRTRQRFDELTQSFAAELQKRSPKGLSLIHI